MTHDDHRPTAADRSPTELPAGGDNAIAVALGVLGDEWNLWILRSTIGGARRYQDWIAHGSISNSVLSSRLTRLTEFGLLEKNRYQERPPRHEYRLTDRGRSIWPVLLSIWAWEQHWAPAADTPLPRMRHTSCGDEFVPVLVCRSCREPVTRRAVVTTVGPSGDWMRSVPAAAGRRRSARAQRPADVVPQTMELIGNRWSVALLGALLLGATRFRDLSEQTGAPPAVIVDRLLRFTELGVTVARRNPERRDWPTYHLTAKGEAFYPVVAAVLDWGQRWFRAADGPALLFRHSECASPFVPRLACSACERDLRARDVEVASRAGGAQFPFAPHRD
jgi:DNA-binding HxlR family transcriptional regulator